MLLFACLALLPAQIEVIDSADFPKELQLRAVTATVRVHNPSQKREGSGVIVKKQDAFVYVLTAHHIVQDAQQLEIEVFSEESYPKLAAAYRGAKLIAKAADVRDLALLRFVSDDKLLGVLPICLTEELPKTNDFPVLTLGCSLGQAPTAQLGKLLGKKNVAAKGAGNPAHFWECDRATAKGRSGGPLIDRRGFVIGICSGTSDGKSYYTHTQEIHRFLKENALDWLTEKDAAKPIKK